MYCSSCGATVANGLNYCKQCGAKLKGAEEEQTLMSPEPLVWAIVAVFVLGLGAFIGLMAMMKHFRFEDGIIFGFTSIILMLTVVIEAFFLWLLLGGKSRAKDAGDPARVKAGFVFNIRKDADDPAQLQPQVTNDLGTASALPVATSSVTEQTTRTLDPVYRERTSK